VLIGFFKVIALHTKMRRIKLIHTNTAFRVIRCYYVVSCVFALALAVNAQVESRLQSKARPYGLDIVEKVNLAGSDEQSVDFQQNTLPGFQDFIDVNLGEGMNINDAAYALDPSKLKIANDATARVYFVGEGAGYHNTLGYNTSGVGVSTGSPQLIFPDASSSNSYLDPTVWWVQRSSSTPLAAGDFVDLGKISAGTTMDYFVIANGANGGSNVYTTKASSNPDGINHVIAFAMEDSPYLLIGFEDLFGGGDRDFNDLLFAVDIGEQNVKNLQALVATPEPSSIALAIGLGAIVWGIKRKEDAKRSLKAC
jgi:hypothetical protein